MPSTPGHNTVPAQEAHRPHTILVFTPGANGFRGTSLPSIHRVF